MSITSFDTLDTLPIHARKADILQSVDANQVTIITAETGAGKSTQVPQYLAEHGYRKIIVTQPRILAARNLSARVRQEYSWRQGRDCTKLIGYRTAMERDDDSENVILYCTDGLQLVRELTGSGTRDRQVLVLDEIHEWNENMEVLVAWAKKRCQADPYFKVVLMSATIEAEDLAAYFGAPAPISVAGRSFDVDKRQGKDVITEVMQQLDSGASNMLVFLPGKAEIEQVAEAVQSKAAAKKVPVIPLHSQLEPEAQQLAFDSYPRGKIILTTNVAQTSITIDDIDVVIDSGLERRSEVRNGVEGLFLSQISQADCLQRAGRAGRTKQGLYILAQYGAMPCPPLPDRPAYGVPEIMRKHVDRLALRLANIGIDIESLDFYHSPSIKTIKLAKHTLVSLGALTGGGSVTDIGRKMERFPVESTFARMLVEAETYPAALQSKLATCIAIQEVGGIVKGSTRYTGWRQFTQQTRSDLLAQYDVFLALSSVDEDEFETMGVIGKNVTKAREVAQRLHHDLGLGDIQFEPITESDSQPLLIAIVAGQLHQIWLTNQDGEAMHIATKQKRQISSGSVVRHAAVIAGTAFDLQVSSSQGLETLRLVNDITAVDPKWLQTLAPDLFAVRPGKLYFDSHHGTLVARTLLRFGGKTFEAAGMPELEHTPQNQKQFITLHSAWLREQVEKQRHLLRAVNSRTIPGVQLRQIEDKVRVLAHGAVSLLEFSKQQRIQLSKLGMLESYVDDATMSRLNAPTSHNARKLYARQGHHGGWQPKHKRKYDRRRD